MHVPFLAASIFHWNCAAKGSSLEQTFYLEHHLDLTGWCCMHCPLLNPSLKDRVTVPRAGLHDAIYKTRAVSRAQQLSRKISYMGWVLQVSRWSGRP